MKEINGYVFIAKFDDWLGRRQILYGKGDSRRSYSQFGMNGLKPYTDAKSVMAGCSKMKADNEHCIEILPKQLEMIMAEDQRDIDSFQKKSHLIVLCSSRGFEGYEFFGSKSIGGPGFDTRCSLEQNGFRVFKKEMGKSAFQNADYAASEIYRQSGNSCKVTLTQIILSPIKP